MVVASFDCVESGFFKSLPLVGLACADGDLPRAQRAKSVA
jgi:hypothetical protein